MNEKPISNATNNLSEEIYKKQCRERLETFKNIMKELDRVLTTEDAKIQAFKYIVGHNMR